ncbi:hypothetical protein [Actinocorallia lasiicapitis]
MLALSHEEQAVRLARSCPEALPAARIVGDLSFDRIVTDRVWRPRYRAALDVRPEQRLVAVSATWDGSPGDQLTLAGRLLRELPRDEFRVALLLHPNIPSGEGRYNVDSWLAELRRDGLLQVPSDEGWHGTLIAADLVVGDHGSVSLYGACLGLPVLLSGFDRDAVVRSTAMWRLGELAPVLDRRRPLRRQIEAAAPIPGLLDAAISRPGLAASQLRGAMFELLGLPEPTAPPVLSPVPPPRPRTGEGGPMIVTTEVSGKTVRIARYPAGGDDHAADAHLVIADPRPHPGHEDPDVMLGAADGPTAADLFKEWPKMSYFAVDGVVQDRDGRRHRVDGLPDPDLAPSVLMAFPDAPREAVVLLGRAEHRVTITPVE